MKTPALQFTCQDLGHTHTYLPTPTPAGMCVFLPASLPIKDQAYAASLPLLHTHTQEEGTLLDFSNMCVHGWLMGIARLPRAAASQHGQASHALYSPNLLSQHFKLPLPHMVAMDEGRRPVPSPVPSPTLLKSSTIMPTSWGTFILPKVGGGGRRTTSSHQTIDHSTRHFFQLVDVGVALELPGGWI